MNHEKVWLQAYCAAIATASGANPIEHSKACCNVADTALVEFKARFCLPDNEPQLEIELYGQGEGDFLMCSSCRVWSHSDQWRNSMLVPSELICPVCQFSNIGPPIAAKGMATSLDAETLPTE